MERWKIEYYKTSAGHEPIQEFIDNLEERYKTRVYHTLELLTEFGPLLRMPHSKKITGTPLWELRILGQVSLRFFYIAVIQKTFLILHGFTKKKQKTPKKERDVALKRLKEHQARA